MWTLIASRLAQKQFDFYSDELKIAKPVFER